ncbi:hypothetical protein FQA39_LY02938 [Lamprigera yunnana]|nr:hypothetical protein FQA39_LY02938 [Lamprigera yunnana]
MSKERMRRKQKVEINLDKMEDNKEKTVTGQIKNGTKKCEKAQRFGHMDRRGLPEQKRKLKEARKKGHRTYLQYLIVDKENHEDGNIMRPKPNYRTLKSIKLQDYQGASRTYDRFHVYAHNENESKLRVNFEIELFSLNNRYPSNYLIV